MEAQLTKPISPDAQAVAISSKLGIRLPYAATVIKTEDGGIRATAVNNGKTEVVEIDKKGNVTRTTTCGPDAPKDHYETRTFGEPDPANWKHVLIKGCQPSTQHAEKEVAVGKLRDALRALSNANAEKKTAKP